MAGLSTSYMSTCMVYHTHESVHTFGGESLEHQSQSGILRFKHLHMAQAMRQYMMQHGTCAFAHHVCCPCCYLFQCLACISGHDVIAMHVRKIFEKHRVRGIADVDLKDGI